MMTNESIEKRVYKIVREIPQGKVMTYGQISSKLDVQKKINPRQVGRILHNNPEPKTIPCHRVVDYKGGISRNYAFGGLSKQREKLEAEGVGFIDLTHVDLKRFQVKSL